MAPGDMLGLSRVGQEEAIVQGAVADGWASGEKLGPPFQTGALASHTLTLIHV